MKCIMRKQENDRQQAKKNNRIITKIIKIITKIEYFKIIEVKRIKNEYKSEIRKEIRLAING